MRFLRFIPLMAVCLGVAHAQEQSYEGKPIVAIEYDPAAQPLAPEDLNAAQPLKIGQALHKEDLADAIDKLFASGRYDDIQTGVQARGNGVVVRIITKSKSFVGHVGTQGKVSSPPNRGQVVNAAQLT